MILGAVFPKINILYNVSEYNGINVSIDRNLGVSTPHLETLFEYYVSCCWIHLWNRCWSCFCYCHRNFCGSIRWHVNLAISNYWGGVWEWNGTPNFDYCEQLVANLMILDGYYRLIDRNYVMIITTQESGSGYKGEFCYVLCHLIDYYKIS